MSKQSKIKASFKYAFPRTIPIFAGYIFLGIPFGVNMSANGFPFWYSTLMSIIVFGGSIQYVEVDMLCASTISYIEDFALAFMIQARQIFYSITMLDKYKDTGAKKPYLIFGMVDETFSINCSAHIPDNIDKGWFYFFVTSLNHLYWIIGTTLGGVLGSVLPTIPKGLDFAMTSIFVVIMLEQILKEKQHYSTIIGFASAIFCLCICKFVFNTTSFMVPTLILIVILLVIFKKPIERKVGDE